MTRFLLLSQGLFVLSLYLICHVPLVSSLRQLNANITSIHFVGDLHADVHCARQWIEKTGLVNVTSNPYKWLGDSEKDALVFLGDYVDKGSKSAATLEFVRTLQQTFPNNVVTILGNHDFFLILDTALSFSTENPHPLGFPFYDYAYSFMHPEEYLESEWVKKREDDEEIYGSLVTALQNAYSRKLEGKVHLCAPTCNDDSQMDIFHIIEPYESNQELAKKAKDRLTTWRAEYAQGLYDSGLLKWMTEQPLVAIVGDALIVHGGISKQVINFLAAVAEREGLSVVETIDVMINQPFHNFFENEMKTVTGPNAIEGRLTENYATEIILNLVQHRGYFGFGIGNNEGCEEVNFVLEKVNENNSNNPVNRIVVGHTPDYYVRELCDGKLLASDSSLSRSFRAHGNLYCPVNNTRADLRDKKSCSRKPEETCDGMISRITRQSPNDDWPSKVKRFDIDELMTTTMDPLSSDLDGKDEL